MAQQPNNDVRIQTIPPQEMNSLATQRIFFGHQSVGQNIVNGLKDILRVHPTIRLNIGEGSRPEDLRKPGFFHAEIGKNFDPISKIDHFGKILESGIGQRADIALFKLCYVDIIQQTDIQALFDYYEKALTFLMTKFPDLRIVIVTVPLTTIPSGIVAELKRMLGRGSGDRADNVRRNLFNQMLQKRFGDSVFDLAGSEATVSEDKKAIFTKDQAPFYFLNRAYTDDGGHLNLLGRQAVASDLLRFLIEVSDKTAVRHS